MGCDKDQQQTQDSYLPEIIGSGDDDLMLQLKDLGLLVDVRNQIQQMDSDGYRILPYLELLSLGKTVERPPEDEIKSRYDFIRNIDTIT
ncbi:hypothetical protein FBU30_002890 [Linnemannia zychae]|nr:hypothetical protein FBU30_002890 [Linnemannia zychae]